MSLEEKKKNKKGQSSSTKSDKSKNVTEEKRLKVQQAADEIEDLFKQRKKSKEDEAEAESLKQERDASNEDKPGKDNQKKKRDRGTRNSEGWYENEDEAGLIPLSDDENGTAEPESEYGIIKSNYKRAKIVNPEAPLERIDKTSGLPVYKAHLLKVGDGGGTPLCPFDCNCCF